MTPSVLRAIAVAAAGAAAAVFVVALSYGFSPAFTLDMDRDAPQVTSGFYPAERQGERTFAWTSDRALLRLPGLNRRVAWECRVSLRGARPAGEPQPTVDVTVDDVAVVRQVLSNDFQEIVVAVPARPAEPGLTLAMVTAPVFVPGPSDRRRLAAQVDRITCQPAGAAWVLPPRRALTGAATSGAIAGAAFGLAGGFLSLAVGGALLIAVLQSIPLTAGAAPYAIAYQQHVAWLALWIMLPLVAAVGFLEWRARRPLTTAARSVMLFSGAVLYLKLLALLHPSKGLVDALFHAHRLEWVLDGRYFFTQPMPSGVQFPYAIALYVFAAPWTALTPDHVAVLRIVVCAAQAFAGALLYPMVLRNWNDRRAAATAVVLFHTVPLPYVIIGNANLTHAFGQSAALVAVAAATVWSLQARAAFQVAGLSVLIAIAFLSHVGLFPLLLSTLLLTALLYRVTGGAPLAPAARGVLIASVVALVVSVAAYYGHFLDVYKTLAGARLQSAAAAPASTATPPPPGRTTSAQPTPLPARVAAAAALAVEAIGWPILLLGAAGGWRVYNQRPRTRLALAVLATGLTCVLFVGSSVVTPVNPTLQRYTDEFILRVYDATTPAIVMLAAYAVSWAVCAGWVYRVAAGILLVAAAVQGVHGWIAWLQ